MKMVKLELDVHHLDNEDIDTIKEMIPKYYEIHSLFPYHTKKIFFYHLFDQKVIIDLKEKINNKIKGKIDKMKITF